MVTAALSFIGHTSQVSLGKLINVVRVDWPLLSLSVFLFNSSSSIQGGCPAEGILIVKEDISLRRTYCLTQRGFVVFSGLRMLWIMDYEKE